jgi:methylglyoxal synthase
MPERLRIALIAHDTKKDALVAWAKRWEHWLASHTLLGTGSSAAAVEHACRIVEGAVDALVFLPDPMNPHPHEADFQALIRVALMVDIPFALSATSADHLARGMATVEGGTASFGPGGR